MLKVASVFLLAVWLAFFALANRNVFRSKLLQCGRARAPALAVVDGGHRLPIPVGWRQTHLLFGVDGHRRNVEKKKLSTAPRHQQRRRRPARARAT